MGAIHSLPAAEPLRWNDPRLLRLTRNYFLTLKKPDLMAGLSISRNLKTHRRKRQESLESDYQIGLTFPAVLHTNKSQCRKRLNGCLACMLRGVEAIALAQMNSIAPGS